MGEEQARYDVLEASAQQRARALLRAASLGRVGQTYWIGTHVWGKPCLSHPGDAGWDIVEPFTFAITLSVMSGSFAYFAFHRADYTYEHLGSVLQRALLRRSCRSANLNISQLDKNKVRLAELKALLE